MLLLPLLLMVAAATPETIEDIRKRELNAAIDDVTLRREGACLRLHDVLELFWNPHDQLEWPRVMRTALPLEGWRSAADTCALLALGAPPQAPWSLPLLLRSAVLQNPELRAKAVERGIAEGEVTQKPDGSLEPLRRSAGTPSLARTSIDPTESAPRVVGRLDPTLVGAVIHANRGQLHYCYESARGHAPANKGNVVAHFVVTATGAVSQVTMEKSTLHNASVETCVLSRIGRWMFPKPKGGGEASVTYPFTFAPLP